MFAARPWITTYPYRWPIGSLPSTCMLCTPLHCTKDVYTPQGSTRDLWTVSYIAESHHNRSVKWSVHLSNEIWVQLKPHTHKKMCEAVRVSLWPLPQIGLSVIPSLKRWTFKAAFTPSKLARASQVSGMRAQTFQASYEKFAGLTWKRVATSIIVVAWNVCALPRHLTRARKAASCKRRLSDSLLLTVLSLLLWTCWVLKTQHVRLCYKGEYKCKAVSMLKAKSWKYRGGWR
jgi:hypothetical protein